MREMRKNIKTTEQIRNPTIVPTPTSAVQKFKFAPHIASGPQRF
jgi:hypothetical protein